MKKALSMCLALLMAVFLLPLNSQAEGASVDVKVVADKSTVYPGDTVNFDVILGAVQDMAGLEFAVTLPEGFTMVDGSTVIPKGVGITLKVEGYDAAKGDDGDISFGNHPTDGWKWAYSVGDESYTGSGEVCIAKFSCTVNSDSAMGEKAVTLTPRDAFTADYEDISLNITPASVTVSKKPVPVTGVTLDQSTLSLKTGGTAKLTAKVEPADADDQTVTWTSSDEAVAAVAADGTVTAKKEGTAVITVKTTDGAKTASCTVTVTCDHKLTKVEAKEATCDEPGNKEYWTCGVCGKKFSDAAGTKKFTGEVTIPAVGHKTGDWKTDDENHWKECSVCGKEFEKKAHAFEWKIDKAATEDETGVKHEECACGKKRSENTEIPKLDHVHTGIQHHEAVPANCKNTGKKEYWTCSSPKCEGKFYGDKNCQAEVTEESLVTGIDPDNHVYDNDEDPDCSLCGYVRYYEVSEGKKISFVKGSASDSKIVIKAEKELFAGVEVDGTALAAENYSLDEESGAVTLKKAYLDTLEAGEHKVSVLYADGKTATAGISVSAPAPTPAPAPAPASTPTPDTGSNNNGADAEAAAQAASMAPKTGDNGSGSVFAGFLICGLLCAVSGFYVRKRSSMKK